MDRVTFDERLVAQLEAFYRTRDIRRRRALVLDALDPRPGERVLDVGCGPGFYVADALERIGPDGHVTGVDASPAMLEATRRRVEGHANVTLAEGDATALPLADATVDCALCVQVLEYVPDVPAALAEMHRVLRPGGRLVLWDVDWATLSWHAADMERMARVTAAWDRHLVHPSLPRTLAADLRAAGFTDVAREGHVFETTAMDPESFGGTSARMVAGYVGALDEPVSREVGGWLEDLQALDARGEYSFAVIQFAVTAQRPV